MMNIFDIFIAEVSWESGGKRRPVLILEQMKSGITVFNITTQYENKSEYIRNKYFKINDWQQAGLKNQSYIDTNDTVTLPPSSVDVEHPTGMLTEFDAEKLIEFLGNG